MSKQEQHLPPDGDGAEDRGALRLNIPISGGTGSARPRCSTPISQMIDPASASLTIEDAPCFQLRSDVAAQLEIAVLDGDVCARRVDHLRIALSSVVLPEPVPPEIRMLRRERAAISAPSPSGRSVVLLGHHVEGDAFLENYD